MGVYTAKAILQGKGGDIWEMFVENIHQLIRLADEAEECDDGYRG